MSTSFKAVLANVEGFRRQIALMNEHTREKTKEAIKHGTHAVVKGAETRAPEVSGELKQTIRAEFAPNGLTGFAKAGFGRLVRRSRATTERGKARAAQLKAKRTAAWKSGKVNSSKKAMALLDLGVYAPVVERGDKKRHHKAHPFMIPAFRSAEPSIKQDIAAALRTVASATERAVS